MKRGTSQSFQLVACCCLIGCWSVTAGAAGIDFQRDIRPLLSATCFECHGPDESHREGELRLDLQADAFADRGGYAAFVAGDIEASAALQRIISNDPDELMGAVLKAEDNARQGMSEIRQMHRIPEPRGFGVSRVLRRELDTYYVEFERLEKEEFDPAWYLMSAITLSTLRMR